MNKTRRIVLAAVLAALTCAATMVIRIPTPTGGYVNMGDTIVLLSAFLMGPVWGLLAGGIGSAMSDILAGYPVWAPATLVIKGLMALSAALIFKKCRNGAGIWLAGLVAEIIMVLGYFAYEAMLSGSAAASAVGIPANLVQGAFGLVVGVLLTKALCRVPAVRELFGVEKC